MLRTNFDHGFPEADWVSAKAEAKRVLIECAQRRAMISYSELVQQIHAVKMEPHDARLSHFLGEVSQEEDSEGRGLLTVVVVHKSGDMEPGPGFFELARTLGRNTSDKQKCWIAELHKVHDVWANGK